MRRLGGLVAVLAACVGLAACGSDSEEDSAEGGAAQDSSEPIVIGVAANLTGFEAPFDVPAVVGLEQAVAEANEAGGLLGRQVKIIKADQASDKANGKAAAEKVISQDADLVVAACDFDWGGAAALAAQAAGKPVFSLCAASARFGAQGIGPLAYTPSHINTVEGAAMAEWGYEEKGCKTAFTLTDTTVAYDVGVSDGFKERFESLGGTLVGGDEIQQSDKSIAPSINRIKSSNADCVHLSSYNPGSATFTRQMRAAGVDQPIFSNQTSDGSYWLEAIPNLSDFYYPAATSIYGDDPDPKVNEFWKNLEESTGEPPVTTYGAFGYALYELYSEAVKRAETTDSEKVAAELNKFDKVPTAVGETSYTEDVHIALQRPMRIMEIQDGKPAFLEKWDLQEPVSYPTEG